MKASPSSERCAALPLICHYISFSLHAVHQAHSSSDLWCVWLNFLAMCVAACVKIVDCSSGVYTCVVCVPNQERCRLLIISTQPYSETEMHAILDIRAEEEDVDVAGQAQWV